MLREIGLQKLGITHLSAPTADEQRANEYLQFAWTDPDLLAAHEFPPDNPRAPELGKLPHKFAYSLQKLYHCAGKFLIFYKSSCI